MSNIQGGTILHAWCWSFNTIKDNMKDIAEAGYTAVQTSPVSTCVVGENGGMQIFGKGKWYYHYQPTIHRIGNYQLGSRDEFITMCQEAHKYGVKIIVDAVLNHCTSNYNLIDENVKNIEDIEIFLVDGVKIRNEVFYTDDEIIEKYNDIFAGR